MHMMPKKRCGYHFLRFNLQQLLEFAKDYHPNRDFVYWVRGAEYTLLNLLESDSSNYQQVLFNEMYLVEEFI